MASFKTLAFVSLLIAVVPISEAQGVTLNLSVVLFQSESFSSVFGTSKGTTATQVFPSNNNLKADTLVMLQCLSGKLVAATTTNAAGEFSMLLDPVQFTSSVLNGCTITVNTTVPSGGAVSAPLHLVGSTLQVVTVTNFIATEFQFIPTLN